MIAAARNVELKARDHDPAGSLAVCRSLDAADHGVLVQSDTYFEVAEGRLKLRRQDGDAAHLVAYRRSDDPDQRASHYWIAAVADAGDTEAALAAALGVSVVVAKERRLFVWESVRIHLDRVDGLGSFLEIEAVAAAGSDLAAEDAKVRALREAFGIRDEDLIGQSYSDLLSDESSRSRGS